ncbi:hypothetical protein JYP51_08630 [Ponticoccus gilvus]|nr:hypothetical protein [Enemella evansiae]
MPKAPYPIAVFSRIFAVILSASPALAEAPLFDPFSGYRMAQYRAPIPAPPEGIPALSTARVQALAAQGATLLDVHPLRTFEIAANGTWLHPERHESLPGALWLPVVGWGTTEAWADAYLHAALEEHASRDAPVIVFCQLDCWLSWNAVQRVRALGYDARWYPGGVDDWQAEGLPLVPLDPLPLQN